MGTYTLQTPITQDHGSPDRAAALIATAEALGPLVAEHRAALALGPDLPVPIARALDQAGLTRMLLPKDVGGAELPLPDFIRVIEALAKHDGSVAWCAAVSSTGSRLVGLFSPKVAHDLFDGEGFATGSIAPGGAAVAEGDGWRVNGRWPWGSFIRYSKVSGGMCVEYENGAPRRLADDSPAFRLVILPTEEVKILDNWNGGGLRSSGSHDFVFENVWIPSERTVALPGFAAAPQFSGPLYRLPLVTTFGLGIGAVPLGIARASIDALVALASTKVPLGMQAPLREQAGVQADVARAETLLRSARAFLFEAVGDYWQAAVDGGAPTLQQRALLRMASWNVAQTAKQVVDLMYSAAGGTAACESAPFAAQLRDVHAAAQHVAFATRNMETAGRILMGMDPGTARF